MFFAQLLELVFSTWLCVTPNEYCRQNWPISDGTEINISISRVHILANWHTWRRELVRFFFRIFVTKQIKRHESEKYRELRTSRKKFHLTHTLHVLHLFRFLRTDLQIFYVHHFTNFYITRGMLVRDDCIPLKLFFIVFLIWYLYVN